MKFWLPIPSRSQGRASWGRTAAAVLLAGWGLAGPVSLGQDSASSEADFRRVSNRLLCQCGCHYMVLSCNMLECASATYIRKTIRTSLERGQSEEAIVASFVDQYGAKILPEPPREGFGWMAWIMPFLALALGGGAVGYVLWLWKTKVAAAGAGPVAASSETGETPTEDRAPAVVEKYRAQIDRELDNE